MRKGNSITGMDVVGRDGASMGKVLELILDHDADRCVGITLREKDLFGLVKPQIVAWDEIVVIGKDAVMIQSAKSVIHPHDNLSIHTVMERDSHLVGMQIFAENGTLLGTIEDVYINEATGRILGYEVSEGLVSDTLSGKRYMRVPHQKTLGDGVVIVADYFADYIEAPADEVMVAGIGDSIQDKTGEISEKEG